MLGSEVKMAVITRGVYVHWGLCSNALLFLGEGRAIFKTSWGSCRFSALCFVRLKLNQIHVRPGLRSGPRSGAYNTPETLYLAEEGDIPSHSPFHSTPAASRLFWPLPPRSKIFCRRPWVLMPSSAIEREMQHLTWDGFDVGGDVLDIGVEWGLNSVTERR